MAYKALYNKYRPTTFEEVAGQRSIVRTMKNAIENGKIAHAYLFCGPRGTGKTSMARLFAKALNCEEGLGHQCNRCPNCLAMNSSSHPDVVEIDAASNNGVEQVRDLIDKVRYAPIKGKYKIYIIDEVHMMSAGAFNALLKTLEEPPEHVIFILATTEPFKVLPTIISRCQRYDFAKIDPKDIRDKLVWILQREGVPYEENALDAVVDLADGGMRDALSILDQALAYGGNNLREKDVLDVFGLTSSAQKCHLLELISAGDVSPVLSLAEEFVSSGIDLKRLIQALLDILKDCLVYIKTGKANLLRQAKENEVNALIGRINDVQANAMIDILIKCQADSKAVGNLRSLFELTLVRMTSLFGGASVVKPIAPAPAPQPAPIVEPKPIERPKPIEQPKPVEEPKPEPKPVEQPKPEPRPEPVIATMPTPKPEPVEETGIYNGTSAPDWLLDEEEEQEEPAPAPIFKPAPAAAPVQPEPKPVEQPKPAEESKPVEREPIFPVKQPEPKPSAPAQPFGEIATEGTPYELDDATLINVMVLGPKYQAQRQALFERWNDLSSLRFDPKYGAVATLLLEGRPFCLCEQALIVKYNFTRQKNRANLRENQKAISEVLSRLLGQKIFIYGIDLDDNSRLLKRYFSDKQIGKLPNPSDVVLNLPK